MPPEVHAVLEALAPQSAGLVAIAGVIVWLAKLIRSEGNKKLLASVARLGRRIGRLEQGRKVDRARIWQLEAVLVAEGVRIPPPLPHDDDVDEDLVDEPDPETAARMSVPPLPSYPQHTRRAS